MIPREGQRLPKNARPRGLRAPEPAGNGVRANGQEGGVYGRGVTLAAKTLQLQRILEFDLMQPGEDQRVIACATGWERVSA